MSSDGLAFLSALVSRSFASSTGRSAFATARSSEAISRSTGSRSLRLQLLVLLGGRGVGRPVDADHVADGAVDALLVLHLDLDLVGDLAFAAACLLPGLDNSARERAAGLLDLVGALRVALQLFLEVQHLGRDAGLRCERRRIGEHLVGLLAPGLPVGLFELAARLFFGLVAVVLGELPIVVSLVEIALAEGLSLLGLGVLAREVDELRLAGRVLARGLLALELALAVLELLDFWGRQRGELVLDALLVLLRELELHLEEGFLLLLPGHARDEFGVAGPDRRKDEQAAGYEPPDRVRALLVPVKSRHRSSILVRATSLDVDHALPLHDVFHVEPEAHEHLEDRAEHDHEKLRRDLVADHPELLQDLALLDASLPVDHR